MIVFKPQVIKIMDGIWHREGMDLRMMPYACLATGSQVMTLERREERESTCPYFVWKHSINPLVAMVQKVDFDTYYCEL